MTNEDWSIKMQRHVYTNLMVIYYLYRPAKKSSVEKYKKKYQFQSLWLAE